MGLTQVAPENVTVQSQFAISSWTVAGKRIAFPIKGDELDGGNRIIRFQRPYRNGAKLDDTGSVERVWKITVEFNNTIQEPGLDENIAIYPDLMFLLLKSFDEHETGDLVVPMDGKVRARAETYHRDNPAEYIDFSVVTFTFVEDSEDGVTTEAFANPTVSGRNIRLIQKTQFSAMQDDTWSDQVAELTELGSDLEGIINAPGRAVDDAQARANAEAGVVLRVGATAQAAAGGNRDAGTGGTSQRTELSLLEVQENAAQVNASRQASLPARRNYLVKETRTIYDISSELGQPVDALLDLNPTIENPFVVLPGTYLVYARWP